MVSQRFCERAVELGLNRSYRIVVLGEEPWVAYDRVHLTRLLRGSTLDELTFRTRDWYESNQIDLRIAIKVQSVDLEHRTLRTDDGFRMPFDKLVLATGAQAIRPKLPGASLEHVYVYRTAQDLLKLRDRISASRSSHHPAVVVGAGLLGLEAAEALMDLGLRVRVLEAADYLLSRQLDRVSAAVVEELLKRRGFEVDTGIRVTHIERRSTSDSLALTLSTEDTLEASLVLLAVGIRPRDELARDVGIRCDLFGGVEINDRLETSAAGVYAIGECTRHKGHSYGLVAPGYAMAEALAEQLSGKSRQFEGIEPSTRLKISGVELSVIGESGTDDVESRILTYRDESHWRRLVLRGGRVVGGTVVGDWEELPLLQDAIVRRTKFRERQERRFQQRRAVWGNGAASLSTWPDSAVVCSCTGATCGTLRRAQADGCSSVDLLTQKTGAGGVCGSCQPLLRGLITGEATPGVAGIAKTTLVAAVLAIVFAILTAAMPAIGYAESTGSGFQLDTLWRDSVIKQITGFSVLGLLVIEALISVRKRIPKVRWGRFASWRAFHAVVGAVVLLGLLVHTGFRLGHNVDRWLIVCLLTTTIVGGGAGVLVAIEPHSPSGRIVSLRSWFTKVHLWLLWPLPVLIAAHVVKVYFF
jgi:nitrite reductase (NADH) large subunit